MSIRLTSAQALVRFLAEQVVERDGVEHRFFGGCFGIFGHGNVAGIGEALYERPDLLTYYQARNEQAMVHAAAGYARMRNRLGALACTSSIGPGATNMVTGTFAANRVAAEADVVIGVGTRWTDFTTASKTAFQNPEVRFVNVNVADFDAQKHGGIALVGDARVTLEALAELLAGWSVGDAHRDEAARLNRKWDAEVERLYGLGHGPLPAQSEVIGAVNAFSSPQDVVVCAAGSMPGDLHKLWRTRDPKGYHVEYGYSCMGYEIAAGLGVKLAAPERAVYVLVGDGSYLMLSSAIVTSIQEGLKLTIVLVDNHGFNSIGGLSRSLGTDGFGTQYRYRKDGSLGLDSDRTPGAVLPLDLAANAASLGAQAVKVKTIDELRSALRDAKRAEKTFVICIEVDRYEGVPAYESWWDVPVAEVSTVDAVKSARSGYEESKKAARPYLDGS